MAPFPCPYHPQQMLTSAFHTCWRCADEFFAAHGVSWRGTEAINITIDDIIVEDEDPPHGGTVQEVIYKLDRILDSSTTRVPSNTKAIEVTTPPPLPHPRLPELPKTASMNDPRISFGIIP
jgi:hypothetical protein